MFFSRLVIIITLLFTSYISPLKLHATPVKIEALDKVINHVRSLRRDGVSGEEIGIILDCHGVITNEDSHHDSHTLKGNILEALKYFREEKVSVVVATAWDDLDVVVQSAIINLGLGDFFDVIPGEKTFLEKFSAGPERKIQLEGRRNGKIVALRFPALKDMYFRQKAFALEIAYPGKVFTHIAGVDDDRGNLKIFEDNFPYTRHYHDECNLTLFYLQSLKTSPAFSPSAAPSSSYIPSVPPPAYIPSAQPPMYIPPSVLASFIKTFAPQEYSSDEEREQFYDGYGSNDE